MPYLYFSTDFYFKRLIGVYWDQLMTSGNDFIGTHSGVIIVLSNIDSMIFKILSLLASPLVLSFSNLRYHECVSHKANLDYF